MSMYNKLSPEVRGQVDVALRYMQENDVGPGCTDIDWDKIRERLSELVLSCIYIEANYETGREGKPGERYYDW